MKYKGHAAIEIRLQTNFDKVDLDNIKKNITIIPNSIRNKFEITYLDYDQTPQNNEIYPGFRIIISGKMPSEKFSIVVNDGMQFN